MRYARATIRLLALCGITAGYYLVWVLGATVFASPRLARNWRNRNCRGWARASARIMGINTSVHNTPPAAPFLLVSNHLSYVDVIVLASQVDCTFVAKSEVAGWPLIGLICRRMNTIFIDRKRKRDIIQAMTEIETTIRRGSSVVFFAEGTSTNGAAVSPFKSSLLEYAAKRHLPVHYASVSYVVPAGETPAGQSVCWWGDMTFPDHLFRLLRLPSFRANLTFGGEPILASDRRVLAAKLWSAVSSQLVQAAALR